jgi:hypothetical protein
MIARKISALPNVVQQAAPGNVSTRGLLERCSIRSDQTKTLQLVSTSGDVRGSRLPTRAESGKGNVPTQRVHLSTVKSGSPPGAGQITSNCHSHNPWLIGRAETYPFGIGSPLPSGLNPSTTPQTYNSERPPFSFNFTASRKGEFPNIREYSRLN